MRRPKALFVTTVAPTLRSFLVPIADYFHSLGWQVDGMANGVSQCEVCRSSFDNLWDISWSRKPLALSNFRTAPSRVRQEVAEGGYDIVHVHTPVAAFVTRYALRRLHRETRPVVIYTAHGFHFHAGNPVYRNIPYITLEKLAGRWTDYLIVINSEDWEAARRYQLVPPERLQYMPGIGLDTTYYDPAAVSPTAIEQVRREMGLRQSDKLFLMIAEFNPGKRHMDAVRALAKLGRGDAVHLAFAGDGPYLEHVRRLSAELGVQQCVHFLGYRSDIPVLIRASVATILPSQREGLPRSVMESLCLGVPVIGADTRGIRDLLKEGGGRLVAVGDVDGYARTLSWALDCPDEVAAEAVCGRRQIERYALSRILEAHRQLYEEALRKKVRSDSCHQLATG